MPFDLGMFDFCVPVSAFDEAHHKAASRLLGQLNQLFDHIGAAFLVSLHGESKTCPIAERGFAR